MTLEKLGFSLAGFKKEKKKEDNKFHDNKESSIAEALGQAAKSVDIFEKAANKIIEVKLDDLQHKTSLIHDPFSKKFEEIFYDGNDLMNKGKEEENSVKYDVRTTSIDNDILDEFISRGDFEGKQDVIRSDLVKTILKHHKGEKIESKEKLLGMFIFADLINEYNNKIKEQEEALNRNNDFNNLNPEEKKIAIKKRYEAIANHLRNFGLVDDASKLDKELKPNYDTAFRSLSGKLEKEKDPHKRKEILQQFVSGFNNAITATHPKKNFKLSNEETLKIEKILNGIASFYLGKDKVLFVQEKVRKDGSWDVFVQSANSGQLELFINETTKDYKSDFELAHEELEKEIKAKEKLELQKKEKEKEEEKKKAPEQKPENTDISDKEEVSHETVFRSLSSRFKREKSDKPLTFSIKSLYIKYI